MAHSGVLVALSRESIGSTHVVAARRDLDYLMTAAANSLCTDATSAKFWSKNRKLMSSLFCFIYSQL
jgi:hypothetical protein